MRVTDEILLQAVKPGRYIGNEINRVVKDPAHIDVRFAFCFPDVYEVGMSHLGLQILYFFLNRLPYVYCERAFMPWTDMAALMKEHDVPLFALETGDAVKDFDFIGFTLQYEMSYTNILAMLDLAGVPLLTAERGEGDPIVCAGGPCACNPEPLSMFVDFFYIGDGEAALDDIMAIYHTHKSEGGTKKAFLEKIAALPGVYVPAFYDVTYREDGTIDTFTPNHPKAPAIIKKALIQSLDETFFPDRFITPLIETVHDRVSLELFRGCIRGCRFCQAGFIYRPVRERRADTLTGQAERLIPGTGHEEISLVSLSTCDYTAFEPLLDALLAKFAGQRVNIALPSLRVDAVSLAAMQKTQSVRKSSLTFAPEAGSQRLRDVINKNLTEDEILTGCYAAFGAGVDRVKLYFMAGLPTETDADCAAVAELAGSIVDQYYRLPKEVRRRPVGLNVSVSCFVPKPFTPFQWEAQNTVEVFAGKQQIIKRHINKKQISFHYHDAQLSVWEGVLARGDRRTGRAIERAWRLGAMFDGWSEHFKPGLWAQAFAETELDPAFYAHRARPLEERLPWDFIDMGVSKAFLLSELDRACAGQTTPHCRDACAGCGMTAFTGGGCHV